LGDSALDGATAWQALTTLLALPRVTFLREPAQVDVWLAEWSGSLDVRGGQWTDAYLAAVAAAGGHRLVAFDADFRRYPGLAFLHLTP
jgi:predicted nucleic acid-binding protein